MKIDRFGYSVRYFIVFVLAVLFLQGCASSRSGRVYSRDEARESLSVFYGTVLEVSPAVIEGTKSPIGPLVGGVTGAVVGSTIGEGSGKDIATVVGGLVGGLAGAAIEEGATRKDALEIVVELDNGQIMAVVQERDDEYRVGDRVRIVKSRNGTSRVRQ